VTGDPPEEAVVTGLSTAQRPWHEALAHFMGCPVCPGTADGCEVAWGLLEEVRAARQTALDAE